MIVVNNHIVAVESTDEQYNMIASIIGDKPSDPSGYVYMLRADTLEWELVELPPVPEPEMTDTDDAALTRYTNELTGDNAETLQEATENLIKIVKEDK